MQEKLEKIFVMKICRFEIQDWWIYLMNSFQACTILETEFASVLLSQLKLGFPSGYLDMTMNVIQTSFHQGYRKAAAQATGDSERQKIIFLTALNCSENSMDYVARYVRISFKNNLKDLWELCFLQMWNSCETFIFKLWMKHEIEIYFAIFSG